MKNEWSRNKGVDKWRTKRKEQYGWLAKSVESYQIMGHEHSANDKTAAMNGTFKSEIFVFDFFSWC